MNESSNTPTPSRWKTVLSRFSRVTSSGSYMPEIDGLRFVAIMAVLLYHAHILFFDRAIPSAISTPMNWDWLNFAIGHGWFGVQVFFVISGFVLALPFAGHHLENKRPVNLKTYYSRRVVRIGFPYIIALTAGFLLALSQGAEFAESIRAYGLGLIYSYTLFNDGALNPILFVSWTLEIEIQFYLLAPLLCKVFAIRSSIARIAILAIGMYGICHVCDWFAPYFSYSLRSHSILGQLQFFLAGLLLGELYISYWKNNPSKPSLRWIWDIVGIAAWLFIPFSLHVDKSFYWLSFLLLLAFTCVLRGNLLKKLLSLRPVATIGGMCYSIYLFHGACLQWIFYNIIWLFFGGNKDIWPHNLVPLFFLTVFTLLGCSIAYYFIERPSMLWGSKKKK